MFQHVSILFDNGIGTGYLSPTEAATFVLSTPKGSVRSLAGANQLGLLGAIDQTEFQSPAPQVLFVEASAATSAEAIAGEIVSRAAETALRLWPSWYDGSGVDFSICQNDSLGRQAISVLARQVARTMPGVQSPWTQKAALAALQGRAPLIGSFPLRVQLEQLTKAIAPCGLVLAISSSPQGPLATPEFFVHALEWLAQSCGVVALFDELPPNEPPFERILHCARCVSDVEQPPLREEPEGPWIAPWRGSPHPLSAIEKKMAAMLAADAELGPLFAFNQTVRTERGTLPKVDLLWTEGRFIVELDGYESHGSRSSFARDRHRDYELMLSGYVVLRLANDEIAQDCEKALEKIRDLARLRRQMLTKEV